MTLKKTLFFTLLILAAIASAEDLTRKQYIEKYADIAIREMQSYGIPASITMAQGILESNNGNSYLAKEANNHFGIKCHDWTGPSVRKDDDKRNECFRKYEDALASFEDHSNFLVNRSRYDFLFDYKIDDYKAWAHGLKKAGYATNPKYPQLLIKIIEDNELFLLDQGVTHNHKPAQGENSTKNTTKNKEKSSYSNNDIIKQIDESIYQTSNGVHYIIINSDINIKQIAKTYQLHIWELYRYNDIDKNKQFSLYRGQRVFIEAKRRKAAKGTAPHKVQTGETMHDIAQQYGIRLKSLYRLNRMYIGTQPQPGNNIELTKRKQKL